jgi:hypothetical protein
MTTTPYNDNELSFNQCKAQKYKALSIALSAECTLLSTLPPSSYQITEDRVDNLFVMIKQLHQQIMALDYDRFSPTETIKKVVPPTF